MRVWNCPYHKCLTGRGVCFMATRAPPQSRNQTLYSSSKIWNNNNNNNNHNSTLHLQSAWVYKVSNRTFFSWSSTIPLGCIVLSYHLPFNKRVEVTMSRHLNNNSKSLSTNIVKQVVKKKWGNKIHVHLDNPKEYRLYTQFSFLVHWYLQMYMWSLSYAVVGNCLVM